VDVEWRRYLEDRYHLWAISVKEFNGYTSSYTNYAPCWKNYAISATKFQ